MYQFSENAIIFVPLDVIWVGVVLSWFNLLAPVQNLFQGFVVGLNVEVQNPFLLLYLAQASIDDYTYPTKPWRYIRLKITVCVQVIGVACSNGKCLIKRSFAQETRKQPCSEINQIVQEKRVLFFLSLLLICKRPPRQRLSLYWLTKMTQL